MAANGKLITSCTVDINTDKFIKWVNLRGSVVYPGLTFTLDQRSLKTKGITRVTFRGPIAEVCSMEIELLIMKLRSSSRILKQLSRRISGMERAYGITKEDLNPRINTWTILEEIYGDGTITPRPPVDPL